jgi:hypothetical protein
VPQSHLNLNMVTIDALIGVDEQSDAYARILVNFYKKDECFFQIRRHGGSSLGDSEEDEQWAMLNRVKKVSVDSHNYSIQHF